MSGSKKAFVIGWPIGHTRSPLIHNYWLKQHNIEGSYEAVEVSPDELPRFLARVRAGAWRGGNVTIPHKLAVLAAADDRDAAASAIGAANTLVSDRGRILAINTDAPGFIGNLDAQAPSWRESGGPAVVLGAGGAALAIVWALLREGVDQVRVVNRTRSRAEALVGQLEPKSAGGIHIVEQHDVDNALKDASLVVNTTSLGMTGMPPLTLDLTQLPSTATVADIVYVPLQTPLIKAAAARGNPVVDGLGMLLHQAVPGFAAWFGVVPNVTSQLRDLVIEDLGYQRANSK